MTTSAPHRIMLATDITPAGDRAFDRAVELAKEWDAELVVLHVVESNKSPRRIAPCGLCSFRDDGVMRVICPTRQIVFKRSTNCRRFNERVSAN
jgi:hypothetical protein